MRSPPNVEASADLCDGKTKREAPYAGSVNDGNCDLPAVGQPMPEFAPMYYR